MAFIVHSTLFIYNRNSEKDNTSSEVLPRTTFDKDSITGCEDESSTSAPSPLIIFCGFGVSTLLVIVGLCVKIRNPNTQRERGSKFKNPLRNMNLTIASVILFSLMLYTISHYVHFPRELLFPR